MQFGKLNFLATLGRREKLLLSGRNVRTHESLLKFSCQKQLKLENFDLVYVPILYIDERLCDVCVYDFHMSSEF